MISHLAIFAVAAVITLCVNAHGGHGGNAAVESNEQYAARHMASEHHIDSFDVKAFFYLHDLNRDGFWDREEIEAVYGVHHPLSQKESPDDKTRQEKADKIVKTVLETIDKDRDGKITPRELEEAGLNALPNFKELGVEGHHYDVESEFFLHHEEIYHATPETQTDDSYNHPEDIEHFALHEKIEGEEEARERKFQGIPDDQPLDHVHDHGSTGSSEVKPDIPGVEPLAPEMTLAPNPHDDQQAFAVDEKPFQIPQRETPPEMLPPEVRFQKAALESRDKDEWGQGAEGYKRPRSATDKMRRNLPYKYRFRRSWGDF